MTLRNHERNRAANWDVGKFSSRLAAFLRLVVFGLLAAVTLSLTVRRRSRPIITADEVPPPVEAAAAPERQVPPPPAPPEEGHIVNSPGPREAAPSDRLPPPQVEVSRHRSQQEASERALHGSRTYALATEAAEPPDELAGRIAESIRRLAPGAIMFNPPSQMQLGKSEIVTVRVSTNLAQDLTSDLQGSGAPQRAEIKVSNIMTVRLSGAAFGVTPMSAEQQPIAAPFTEWNWNVEPRRAGVHKLFLSVGARLQLPGRPDETKEYPLFAREIAVKINYLQATFGFLGSNWQWLVGVAVALAGGWGAIRGWIGRRRRATGTPRRRRGRRDKTRGATGE